MIMLNHDELAPVGQRPSPTEGQIYGAEFFDDCGDFEMSLGDADTPDEFYGDQPDVIELGKLKAGETLTPEKLALMMESIEILNSPDDDSTSKPPDHTFKALTMAQLMAVKAEMDDKDGLSCAVCGGPAYYFDDCASPYCQSCKPS